MVPCINADGVIGMYDKANDVFKGSDGTGAFIAGTPTGKLVTSPSFARKIKKAYIGIGGVARPCWSGGEPAYYGTVTGLSVYGYCAATSVGNYALFGGGYVTKSASTVSAYDAVLTKTTSASLSTGREDLAATSIGDYALFAGGRTIDPWNNEITGTKVDAFNKSLTRSTPTALVVSAEEFAAASNGSYALFGGGFTEYYEAEGTIGNTKYVSAYNASLTRTAPTSLSGYMARHAAASVGAYVLFGGGYNDYMTPLSVVNAYNTSLTRTTPTALSVARALLAATSIGDYALFGGGAGSGAVDAYNASLTRTTPTALSVARYSLSATNLGVYALFGGGYDSKVVDIYDASLTRTAPTELSVIHNKGAAASIGNYALFGGGYNTTVVDVYTVA